MKIYSFFLPSFKIIALILCFTSSTTVALTPDQIAFLVEAEKKGVPDGALWGFEITDKEAKDSKRFKKLNQLKDSAEVECKALKGILRNHVVSLKGLTLATLNSDYSYPAYFFREEGVLATSYTESAARLALSLKHRHMFDHLFVSTDEVCASDFLSFRLLSNPLGYAAYLRYFEFDLIFISSLFESVLADAPLAEVIEFLTTLSDKTPFLVLSLPKKSPHADKPEGLFKIKKNVEITEVDLPKDHPNRLYFVRKMRATVGGKSYGGRPLKYRPKFGRYAWIGDEVVVKQYHQKGGKFYTLTKYSNTLCFYEMALAHNLTFVPDLLGSEVHEDSALIVMKNEGIPLKVYLEGKSSSVMHQLLSMLIGIFCELERLKMNPQDIKDDNVIVNKEGKLFLIDYDNASITAAPVLPEFLCILWGLSEGKKKGQYTARTFIESYKEYPLKDYLPDFKAYVQPILHGKVRTFKALQGELGK